MPRRKKIIVVGYPLGRVGSSALMGLLVRGGAYPGEERDLSGPAPMNPKGFFELPAQEEFLREAWAGIYPHLSLPPSAAQTDAVGAAFAERYAELLEAHFVDADPIAVKSQWFLTLPFLHRLRDRYDVRLLLMERDREDQIRSLLRVFRTTDRPSYQHADRGFLNRYIEEWTRFGRETRERYSFPVHEVRFERLMENPDAVTGEICRFAGLETPPEKTLREWLDPSLINRPALDGEVGEIPARTPSGETPLLSLVVNTRNEEANLEGCLLSIAGSVDEIVVVDMESEDRTVEIARRFTDRVFTHAKTGVVEGARQFAIDKARGEWVFLLDADERATPEFAAGLRRVIAAAGNTALFRVPRRNRIAGRWFAGSGLGPDVELQPRLFRKSAVRWPARIHAAPEIDGKEAVLPLPPEARIDHTPYPDLSSFVERLNLYTDHEARALAGAGRTWSPEAMLEAARMELLSRYQPEKDGAHSLALAGLMAFYRFVAWAKLWEMEGYPDAPLPADGGALARAFAGAEEIGRPEARPSASRTGRAAPSPRRGVRLGLLMADSTPLNERYNEQAPAAFGHFRSYLREKMPECEVIYRYTVEDLLAEKVDIAGISSSTEEFELAKEMARNCRGAGVPVLVGGVHITALPENLSPDMNAAVLGEGEETLHELLRLFASRGRRLPEEDLRRIRGIAFRSGGALVRTPPRPLIANLDDLPIPEREFLWIGKPSGRAFLSTTRGCPYRCVFCASSSFWGSMRHFSAERVVDEVETLHRDLGLGELHFHDDLFITPIKRLERIASLLEERGLAGAIRFSGTVRANLVDDRLCDILNRMGFWAVMFGAESFSDRVLRYLKCDTVSPEENQRALDTLHRNGITAFVQMIFGSPVETREDLRATFEALERNFENGRLERWQEGILTPYPGTPVWEEAKRAGLVSERMNWNRIRDREIYMGGIPEREFHAMLEEHRDRCIAIRPEQEDLWREWGISKERVLERVLRERPGTIASTLDFSSDERDLQIGPGWYAHERSPSGGGFRWMGRESTAWLRGATDLGRLEIAGYAVLDRHPEKKLRIEAEVNGVPAGAAIVGEPGFTVSFPIPEKVRGDRLLRVLLRADHVFRSPPDLRDLGVSVSRIALASAAVRAAIAPQPQNA